MPNSFDKYKQQLFPWSCNWIHKRGLSTRMAAKKYNSSSILVRKNFLQEEIKWFPIKFWGSDLKKKGLQDIFYGTFQRREAENSHFWDLFVYVMQSLNAVI